MLVLLGQERHGPLVTHNVYYTYAVRRGWHPMIGGVWRRTSPVRRETITDEEAAALYLRPRRDAEMRAGEQRCLT